MNENEAMRLLAEANPVRVDAIGGMEMPSSVFASRRSSKRLVLAAAMALLVLLAASLIGVFAFGSSTRHLERGGSMLVPLPTLAHPLPPGAQQVSLSGATQALGASIVLPDSSFAAPSDVGAVWTHSEGPVTDVAVTFPDRALIVDYERPLQYPEPVSAMYETEAKQQPNLLSTINLNGVPALATAQNSDQFHQNFGAIEFVENGTVVRVMGHYDEPTLKAVAQSIVGQESTSSGTLLGVGSPPSLAHPLGNGKQVSLAEAARAFGGEIVQPDTGVVSESGAGAVWFVGDPQVTTVAVTYPRADVWVTYTWPVSYDGGYDDRLLRYHANSRMTHSALLDGVPAQVVFHSWKSRRWSGFYPSVHFAAGGVNIAVEGRQDKTALEAIARSIVDRSEAPPAGQLGNVAGVQVYPYLGHGKQISLSAASATLGSPVVLPDSPLAPTSGAHAWAEGTCPHPGATPATTEVCAVWVSFPGSGLSVAYIRPPAYLGTASEWGLQARGLRSHGSAVHLDGVPALSIHRNPGAGYPGRVELDLDGTRVVVAGDYSPARLQEVARSIVDRSRS